MNWVASFTNFIKSKHFWRKATFNEMSALYLSRILRVLALNLSSVFIFTFLLKSGRDIKQVVFYMVVALMLQALFMPLGALLSAKFGAKKVLLLGNILYIPVLVILSLADFSNQFIFIFSAVLQGLAVSIYLLAYNIIFSEVKNNKNAGSEIGFMMIFEKIATIVAPVVGGILIINFGAKVTMLVSSFLLLIASVPLFKAQGLAKKRHYFNLRGFPWQSYKANFLGQFGRGFNYGSNMIWPVFVSLFLVTNANAYGVVGWVTALQSLTSFVAAFVIGRVLDKEVISVKKLFIYSVLAQSLVLAVRLVAKGQLGAIIFSSLYGLSSIAYYVPFLKAQFNAADQSGSRVVYEMALQFSYVFFSGLASAFFLVLLYLFSIETAFFIMFLATPIFFATFIWSDYPMFRKK